MRSVGEWKTEKDEVSMCLLHMTAYTLRVCKPMHI